MKTIKIIGLFLLVQLFSAASAFGQTRVVLDQTSDAVAFSQDNKNWGLEVNGKVVKSGYKTIGYQNGLFILENWEGNWNVCDAAGNNKFSSWTKASDVKVSEKYVLFEKAKGNEALIYDRATWTLTVAKETSSDAMYKEMQQYYADKHGTPVLNYETAAERSRRLWKTQPRVVTKGGKQYIMFQDIEVGYADEVISLDKDYDVDGRWYFKIKNNKGNWGVGFVKEDNPSKILFSIAFNYTKIESANNGWKMLNCYLLDGTVELRWYGGSTTAQKSIPAAQN